MITELESSLSPVRPLALPTLPRLFVDLDQAALCAALTAVGVNAFGVLPAHTSGWLFVVWTSGAVASLLLALAATSAVGLFAALPPGYAVAVAGLAILSPLQNALVKAFAGNLRFGALVAFAVAATPFAVAGITSACWALPAGVVASRLCERAELEAHWHQGDPEEASGSERRVVPPRREG